MPMNPRILKRLWTLHLNLKNKRDYEKKSVNKILL